MFWDFLFYRDLLDDSAVGVHVALSGKDHTVFVCIATVGQDDIDRSRGLDSLIYPGAIVGLGDFADVDSFVVAVRRGFGGIDLVGSHKEHRLWRIYPDSSLVEHGLNAIVDDGLDGGVGSDDVVEAAVVDLERRGAVYAVVFGVGSHLGAGDILSVESVFMQLIEHEYDDERLNLR